MHLSSTSRYIYQVMPLGNDTVKSIDHEFLTIYRPEMITREDSWKKKKYIKNCDWPILRAVLYCKAR